MAIRQLEGHAVEKVWGRRDLPAMYGDAADRTEPVGEIWFADDAAPDLLVKYLFTSERLSIQVHPDDTQAQASGYRCGKEEAWYVLSAEPGAVIGAGFTAAMTAEELRAAALDGSIEGLMTWHPVEAGDFFHVPAGTVHAIGAGLSLVEIQQNVDLTYRLYDYGRPRELHLDDGIAAAVAAPFVPAETRACGPARDVLAASDKFTIERLTGGMDHHVAASTQRPAWIMPIAGGCTAGDALLAPGTVWLAETPTAVTLGNSATLLVARAGGTQDYE
jgi:mannose-6-phosphate isomerase